MFVVRHIGFSTLNCTDVNCSLLFTSVSNFCDLLVLHCILAKLGPIHNMVAVMLYSCSLFSVCILRHSKSQEWVSYCFVSWISYWTGLWADLKQHCSFFPSCLFISFRLSLLFSFDIKNSAKFISHYTTV